MAYIAFGMVAIKLLLDLSVFLVKRINVYHSEQANSDEASCIFCHEREGKDVCVHILFKRKMKKNICPREKCLGFNTKQSKIDEDTALVNIPWLLSIKKAVDLFPEFAAALLALNEILSK